MNAFFEMTNGFKFQIIDPLIESRGVHLTWFDCKGLTEIEDLLCYAIYGVQLHRVPFGFDSHLEVVTPTLIGIYLTFSDRIDIKIIIKKCQKWF